MTSIDAPVAFERSAIAFYVFTTLINYIVYEAVTEVKPRFVFFIKWPLLLFAIATIIFAVVAFIYSANLTLGDV